MSQQSPSARKVLDSPLMQRIKSIVVDKSYKKIKKSIRQNRFNPIKWAGSITRFTIHLIFLVVFRIIGVVLATVSLPFGKWTKAAAKNRAKSVYTVFDTIARVLEGIIVLVVDSVVRLLLCPHWWYTVIVTAKQHARDDNISFQDSLSLCVAESFLAVVEHAFRANFGDMPQLDAEKKRKISESVQKALPKEIMNINNQQYRSLLCNGDEKLEMTEMQPIEFGDDAKSDLGSDSIEKIMLGANLMDYFKVDKKCVKCEDYSRDHACIPCGCKVLCNNSDCHSLCDEICPECNEAITGFLKIKEC